MINSKQIKPELPVVCSKNGQFAVVDHMEGEGTIKLKKDKQGQHHYIPMSWVTSVDDKVHVDRPGEQAMKEWSTTPGAKFSGNTVDAAKSKSGASMSGERGQQDRATSEGMKAPTAKTPPKTAPKTPGDLTAH